MNIRHFVLRPDQHQGESTFNATGGPTPAPLALSFTFPEDACMASATEVAGALAAQMFKAVDSEIPSGPSDIPKLLDVLQRNGVTAAA